MRPLTAVSDTGAALQRVLAALTAHGHEPRPSGAGWAAKCPAHDDRTPSLSVTGGRQGALVHCHAGCAVDAVTDALGLAMTDLFDAEPTDENPIAVGWRDYRDRGGSVLYRKLRCIPESGHRTFRVVHPVGDKWKGGIGDAERVLLDLPEVLTAIEAGTPVWIAEGESDVDRLRLAGVVATCNFDGASKDGEKPKWRPEYSDTLKGADVVIVIDNDSPGLAHGRAISQSLMGKATSIVMLRPALDFKGADVRDHLDAGLGLDGLIPVTPDYVPPVKDVGEVEAAQARFEGDVAVKARDIRVREAAKRRVRKEDSPRADIPEMIELTDLLERPVAAVQYRIADLLPAGGRVILAAQGKSGKSTLVGSLIRSLVDGVPFLDTYPTSPVGDNVVLLDLEMTEAKLQEWLTDQGVANPSRVKVMALRGKVSSFDILDPEVLADWAGRLRAAFADVLILDPLRPVLDVLGVKESTEVGRVLVALDELAALAGVKEMIVVHHMGHTEERSRGDSRLIDWPDANWTLVREDENPASPRFFKAYGRDVDVAESALFYDPVTRHLSLAGTGDRVDGAARKVIPEVLALLAEHPGGLSGREVERLLVEDGCARNHVRRALVAARGDGRVKTISGPRRSELHVLTP